MISRGRESQASFEDVENISQIDIAAYYLKIKSIPCTIKSPFREDKHPSFTLYNPIGEKVNYRDFSTGEAGTIWKLLSRLWNCNVYDVLTKVVKNFHENHCNKLVKYNGKNSIFNCSISRSKVIIQCKTRSWQHFDLDYWKSYGIPIKWLKYADVYPVSHKIVIKDNKTYVFAADKYTYAYVEFKEGHTTLKIYQPFNTKGYKWSNTHDKSVISLWTKVPPFGDKICICSSLKDALCLWINAGIPAVAIQGEGYLISNSAISELKRRFKKIYICLDNDSTGLEDGVKLSLSTGFINVVLPQFKGGKDISDYYKALEDKSKFKQLFSELIK